MRNDRSSIQRCLFKIHERFYCDLPYRGPSQKGEQGHIERGEEREKEREGEIVAHILDYTSAQNRERIGEKELAREGRGRRRGVLARTPRNILIVEFSVRAAYPLEPLCALPGADLLIINYSNHEMHPSPPTTLRGYYPVTFAAAFRRYNPSFFIAVAVLAEKI